MLWLTYNWAGRWIRGIKNICDSFWRIIQASLASPDWNTIGPAFCFSGMERQFLIAFDRTSREFQKLCNRRFSDRRMCTATLYLSQSGSRGSELIRINLTSLSFLSGMQQTTSHPTFAFLGPARLPAAWYHPHPFLQRWATTTQTTPTEKHANPTRSTAITHRERHL